MRNVYALAALMAIALMTPASSPSAEALPVRVGQEWRYEGKTTRATGSERPARHSFRATVTLVSRQGATPEAIRFHDEAGGAFALEASSAWITGDGEENTPLPAGILLTPEMRLAEGLNLPAPFRGGLKPGAQRLARVPLFGLAPPFPQTLPVRRRVVGLERIGPHQCLRIERRLATPLPLGTLWLRVLEHREQFWVDRASGALVKYEGMARVQEGDHGPAATLTASLRLQGVRPLPTPELRQRQAQARDLIAAADLLWNPSGEPAEARVREAQTRLERFGHAYPHSPYAPAAASLAARVQSALGGRQREQQMAAQQAALVGKPAPALALKDLEGKEQTLGHYRGKIILLNVFASW
jgi:hypothetical protein